MMSEVACSKPKEPRFLVYKYIDSDSDRVCRRDSTAQERRETLQAVIGHVWPGLDDRRRKPILNVFVKLLAFTRRNQFTAPRITTSISILIETLLILSQRQLPQPEFVFAKFQSILIRHSIKRTPFSIAVFSLIEVKLLTQFILDRVLRYCHLYQYLLGKSQHLNLQVFRCIAPLPSSIPPLSQAKPVLPEPVAPLKSETEAETHDALTPEQIQMILSDPVAKARFEALVQPKLAELQSYLDKEIENLDHIYAEQKGNEKSSK